MQRQKQIPRRPANGAGRKIRAALLVMTTNKANESGPVAQGDVAAQAVQGERKRHDQRQHGHVQRQNPVRESVFRDGKYSEEVTDGEEHPGERAVAVRFFPHKNDGGDGGTDIGNEREV
jgi:hypothetical protein